MILKKHRQTLELDRVLGLLSECAGCGDAARMALEIEPQDTLPQAARLMDSTLAAHSLSNRYGYPSFPQMVNCAGCLKRAQLSGSLTLRELLDVALILKTMRGLEAYRRQAEQGAGALEPLFESLFVNRALEDRISGAVVSAEELDDNASAELSDIRRKIRAAGLRIRSQLDGMIRSTAYQKYLQEPIVTIRDGRFVVPVRVEYKNEVKGLVHDISSSGATFFIEPMGVVDLNNEIRALQNREEQEIERIIAELSALVGEHADEILSGYDAAVLLDLQFAKARLADRMRAAAPSLTDSGETSLVAARHPLIDSEKAVPIDIAVGGEWDTLVVTGPNTGGKTVAIKTLGLLTLMAMCGLMIPASDRSVVTVYSRVLADIGDEQSIEQSLSTFSSHMVNIISIVAAADGRSLALLDELGAGTDPVEGAALAIAILETLRKKGAKTAATTHYPEIKLYALDTQGVQNASCEFDVTSLRPTYRLLTGIPGRSNAFLISERLGLDAAIIERARELISNENTRFEDVVSELEATRQSLEREREQAQALRREAQCLFDEAKAERMRIEKNAEKELDRARVSARRIVEETRIQSEILFEELEAVKKEKDSERFSELLAAARQGSRSELRQMEQAADPVSERAAESDKPTRPLEKGDIVFVRTLNKEGLVLQKPQGTTVLVQAGLIKTSVPLSEVSLGERKTDRQHKSTGRVVRSGVASRAERDIKTELDLRGMDSQQAILELDAFLDRALLSGVESVRIIHGKGTGVLRDAVAQRLKSNRSVDSFRLGRYGEGENGVTIAQLK